MGGKDFFEHEFENASDAHIKPFNGNGNPPLIRRRTMITMIICLLGSSIFAWWHRRQAAHKA